MKILGKVLGAAALGAIIVTMAWLIYAFGYIMQQPGYSSAWSGIEPFILAPFFLVIGAILGGVIGGLYLKYGARNMQIAGSRKD